MTVNFVRNDTEYYVTFGIPSRIENFEVVVASLVQSTVSAEDDASNRLSAAYSAAGKLVRITIPLPLIATPNTPPSIRVVGQELHLTWRDVESSTLYAICGDIFFVKDNGAIAQLQVSLRVL